MSSSFQEMSPADLKAIRSLPGNQQCIECSSKNPEWASVSFAILFCLDCSGIHRGLGTHISFVRSLTMDSWSEQQMKLMKCGGNDACQNFLAKHGALPKDGKGSTDLRTIISEKYASPAAQLYKQVLLARVEGRPEPSELPKQEPSKKKKIDVRGIGSSPAPSSKKSVWKTAVGVTTTVVVVGGGALLFWSSHHS